jgi:hypothetical protein
MYKPILSQTGKKARWKGTSGEAHLRSIPATVWRTIRHGDDDDQDDDDDDDDVDGVDDAKFPIKHF